MGSDHEAGFTLLEMVVVLAIVGLGFATATLAMKPIRDRGLVRRTTASFRTLAALARERAIDTGQAVTLSIGKGDREISIEDLNRSERLSSDVDLAWISGVDRFGADLATDRARILFLPDGTSSGGKLSARMGHASASVRISWVSGAAIDEP